MMVRCPKCGEIKDQGAFGRDRSTPSGFSCWCRECVREKSRRYYATNSERVKAQGKAYYWANREYCLAQVKDYQTKHAEAVARRYQDYREAHRSQLAAATRRWRQKNPQRNRAACLRWRAANLDRARELGRQAWQRYAAKKRGLENTFTNEQWEDTLRIFGHRCAYCGRPSTVAGDLTRDHVVPVNADGAFVFGNIVPACKHDNSSKQSRGYANWMAEKGYDIAAFEDKLLNLEWLASEAT